jgi:hypothetical protein
MKGGIPLIGIMIIFLGIIIISMSVVFFLRIHLIKTIQTEFKFTDAQDSLISLLADPYLYRNLSLYLAGKQRLIATLYYYSEEPVVCDYNVKLLLKRFLEPLENYVKSLENRTDMLAGNCYTLEAEKLKIEKGDCEKILTVDGYVVVPDDRLVVQITLTK